MKKNKFLFIILSLIFLLSTIVIFPRERVTLNALVISKSEALSLKSFISDITKNTGVKINLEYILDDTNDKFDMSSAWNDIENFIANDANLKNIDMLFGIPYEYQIHLIKESKLLNLENYLDKSLLDNIYEPLIDIPKQLGKEEIPFLSPVFSTQFLVVDKRISSSYRDKGYMSWEDINKELMNFKKGKALISFGPGGLEGLSTDLEMLLLSLSKPFIENQYIYNDTLLYNELYNLLEIYKNYGYKKSYVEVLDSIYEENELLFNIVYPPQLGDLTKNKEFESKYDIFPTPTFKDMNDVANLRIQPFSILKSSEKVEESLAVISYIMSEDVAVNLLKGRYSIPQCEFVSHISKNVKELYGQKYKLDNTDFIYFGKEGNLNTSKFIFEEYSLFHQISSLYFPDIIEGKIDISDGISKIKNDFYDTIKKIN